MRSGLIFTAANRITNRYLLCRMLSASARKMHRDGVSTSQSINRSLQALQDTREADPGPDPQADNENLVLAEKETAALTP